MSLDHDVDTSRAHESIGEDIKASAAERLGHYVFK
jgi:hypothetical protein